MLKLLRTGVLGRNRPLPPTPRNTAPPGASPRNAWRTGLLAAALGLLSVGSASAQNVSTYTFAQSAGAYTAITGGAVLLNPATMDDVSFGGNAIGFTFGYNGQTFRNFNVNTNGWISLGDTNVGAGDYVPLNTFANTIAALGVDLQGNNPGSELRFQTTGSIPNRVLTVQFTSYKKFGGGGTGDDFNFQIKLYETSNNVQMVYGAFTNNAGITTGQAGLRGTLAADFNNRTGTDLDLTTAGASAATTVTTTTAAIPTSGLTFTYTNPGSPCMVPYIRTAEPGINDVTVTAVRAGSGTLEYDIRTTVGPGAYETNFSPLISTYLGSPLVANTSYDVRVRTDCGAGIFSAYTAVVTFRTLCAAQSATIAENFQTTTGTNLPACWSRIIGLSNLGSVTTLASANFPGVGNRAAQIVASATYNGLTRDILVLPLLADLGGNFRQLRFDARASSTGGIDIGTISGVGQLATFTPIASNVQVGTVVQNLIINLNTVSGQFLAIRPTIATGGAGRTYQFDNVFYEPALSCANPTALALAAGTISTNGAGITFNPAPGSASTTVYIGDNTYAPTPGTPTGAGYLNTFSGVNGSSYSITGLLSNTTYRVYIRGFCGVGDESIFVGPLSFTTLAGPLTFAITRTPNITYTSIVPNGGTLAVPFAGAGTDDQLSTAIPFTFTFNPTGSSPQAITGVRVSTNGNIQLQGPVGATSSGTYGGLTPFVGTSMSTTTFQYALFPFHEDLNQSSQAVGVTHKYLITNVTPNRVLTVEWVNTTKFGNLGASLNFQVVIHEATGMIEYVYGNMTAYNGTTIAPRYDYELGLKGAGAATQLAMQQRENTDYFQNVQKYLQLTPDCNSKITFTPGTYTGTPPPAIAAPGNDLICSAAGLTINNVSTPATQFCTYYRSNLATASVGVPVCGTSDADDDVWFTVTTPNTGLATTNLQIRVGASSGYTPTLQIFTSSNGTCSGTLTQVGTCATGTTGGFVTQGITAPSLTTYFIRVNSSGVGSGTLGQFVIDAFGLPNPPANDNCAGAIALGNSLPACSNTPTTYTNYAATASGNAGIIGTCNAIPPSNDVWFTFVATQNGASVQVTGTAPMQPSIEVFSGACAALTSLGCNTAAVAGGTATLTTNVTAGQTYRVRVSDVAGPGGSFIICVQELIFLGNDNPTTTGAGTLYDLTPAPTCVTTNGTTVGAFGPYNTTTNWTSSPDDDVYYSFQATTAAANITVVPASPTFSPVIEAFNGLPPAGAVVERDDISGAAGVPLTLELTGLTIGTRYYFRIFSVGTSERSAFTVCVQEVVPPGNDAPAAALVAPYVLTSAAICTNISGTTVGATNSPNPGLNPAPKFFGTIAAANDVFYTFVVTGVQAPAIRLITVEPFGTNQTTFDPVIQVLTESGGTYTPVAFVDNSNPSFPESLTLTGLAAGTYYVRVYNSQDAGTTNGGFNICLTNGAKALSGQPNVLQGPTTTVGAGTTLNHILTVEISVQGASGTLPFSLARFNSTNVNNADVTSARLYFSPDFTFNPTGAGADQLVGTATISGGNYTFNSVLADIPVGFSYFFLAYNIAPGATAGNTVDAQVQANQFTIGGVNYPSTLRNPTGNRTITPPPPAFDNICGAITPPISAPYAPVVYQQYSNANATTGGPAGCSGIGNDVWFTVPVPASRNLYIDTQLGTNTDLVMEVFSTSTNFCTGTLTSLVCDDDGGVGFASSIALTAIPANITRVFFRVGSFGGGGTGTFNIAVADRPKFTGTTSTAFNTATTTNFFPQSDNQGTILTTRTVTIPAGLTNMPVVSTNQSVYGVVIAPGATLSLTGTAILTLGNGGITTLGTLNQSTTSEVFVNGAGNVSLQSMTFENLRVGAQGVTLAGNVFVRRVLRLQGNLTTSGRTLQIQSNATATGLVWDDGGNVTGNAQVQRYIDPSISITPITYRHLSSPVTSVNGLNDFSTGSPNYYQVITNTTWNNDTSSRPFPTLFAYNESRINASRSQFFAGYFSPNSPASPLGTAGLEMKGYSALMGDGANPDFNGLLHTGNYSATGLSFSGLALNGGWHLLGNPYPAPMDWATVANAQIVNMNGAISIARSTAPNAGNYISFVNGVGPAKYVPMAQGFFMRANTGGNGSVALTNANRVTTYIPASNLHYRTAAETRPLVALTLVESGQPVTFGDETFVYFENGATDQMDNFFDAYKLRSMGVTPSVFTKVGTEEAAINGLPALGTDEVLVPLGVVVGVTGAYKLNVSQFLNIPASVPVVLRDAITGTEQDLRANPTYAFTMDANYGGSRFTLVFNPAGRVTGVNAALAANQLNVFPNPVAKSASLQVQMTSLNTNVKSVKASLVDALGRVVATQNFAVVNGEVNGAISTRSLSTGVYTLRLTAGAQHATRRVVIE